MSFICRYQIVLDDTSITVHKPTLWPIRISPVTPLYMSQSEMRRIKTQLAFVRCCSLCIQAHRFLYFLCRIKPQVKTFPIALLSQLGILSLKNPLSPDKTEFLQFTGVYKKCGSGGINLSRSFPNPFHNVGINMNRKFDLTTGRAGEGSMSGQPK